MKKLILINPVGQTSGYMLSKFSTIPPLGLAYVAAVTPSHWEVQISDENFAPIPFEEADLVGISAFTSNINRAYEIALEYQKRNTKVVIGGIHASIMPDEALRFCDAVVIGEAEGVWGRVVEDFEKGQLKGKYTGPRIDLEHQSVRPRRDLIDPRYIFQSIQTSRGCPFDCDFCTVSRYLGKTYRQRTAADVLDELKQIKGRYIFFLDDNLIGHTRRSKQRGRDIFSGMIELGLNKRWWMQTSIDSVDDAETLRLAAQAGCMFAFIGFETLSDASLQDMNKGINLQIGIENYRKTINALHAHGIGVVGAFIIGNNHESPHYYQKLARFIVRSGIDAVQIAILTPLPGTRFMDRIQEKGDLLYEDFPKNWDQFRLSYVVHRPEGLTAATIYTGNNYLKNYIYRFPRFHFRMLRSFLNLRKPVNFLAMYKFNKALKRSWMRSHYYGNYPTHFSSLS